MQTSTTSIQWIPVVASLIGGGAFGAVITALVTRYRNRRQPVAFSIEVIEIFRENPELPSLQAVLSAGQDPETGLIGAQVILPNLSVARITLVNKGNLDIAKFDFGLTMEHEDIAFDVKTETGDRHHVVEVLTPVDVFNMKPKLDFSLRPFNRGDRYSLNVYFTSSESPGLIRLSSPHPTKFVELGAPGEIAFGFGEGLEASLSGTSLFEHILRRLKK